MKRIAVWGFGAYGRRMVRQIREQWSHRYEIAMIFDRAFAEINRSGDVEDVVRDPGELPECYRQGLFDAVMIPIADYLVYKEIKDHLQAHSIPVETIGRAEDFLPSFQIPGVESRRLEGIPGGYRYSVLRKCYAVRFCLNWGPLFLLDGTGHVLQDNWNNGGIQSNHYQMDYPIPLEKPPAEPVLLPGPYCVIGKLWGTNYWHFTFDEMDQVYLLEKMGYDGKYIVPRSSSGRELLALLGVGPERILWQDELPERDPVCLEELIVVTQEKYSWNKRAPVLLEMADTLLSPLLQTGPERTYPSRLFVRRIGTRKLLNAEALLEKYGFAEIVPEELTVREQMLYFHFADIVLCPHGATRPTPFICGRGARSSRPLEKTGSIRAVFQHCFTGACTTSPWWSGRFIQWIERTG